jgi:hypothetical protein
MPGFLTHYLGGQAALAQLPDGVSTGIKNKYERVFNLGAQGSDIFFYYVPGFMRARTRGIGSEIHHKNFGMFFMQMARRAKRVLDTEQRETLFAYLSGFLVHYALDAYAHPFVYGNTRREGATPSQESAEHRHFETCVDVLMLARLRGQRPADYRQWELIQPPAKQKRTAAAVFGAAARQVYGKDIRPQDAYHAMGHMAQLTRLLDSTGGRRKAIVSRLEDATLGARLLSAMVHPQEVADGRDYLNLSRAHWRTPWDASKEYTTSFPELFDAGVTEAASMINNLHAYMNGEINAKQLAVLIGNRSLATGEPCAAS